MGLVPHLGTGPRTGPMSHLCHASFVSFVGEKWEVGQMWHESLLRPDMINKIYCYHSISLVILFQQSTMKPMIGPKCSSDYLKLCSFPLCDLTGLDRSWPVNAVNDRFWNWDRSRGPCKRFIGTNLYLHLCSVLLAQLLGTTQHDCNFD